MHEETREPMVTSTGTLVSEVGQDGTWLARLNFILGCCSGVQQWRHRGTQVASAHVLGADPRQNIGASIEGTLNPEPFLWTGG